MSDAPTTTTDDVPTTPSADAAQAWMLDSHDLLALTDGQGRLCWANPSFMAATGWSGQDQSGIAGTNIESLLPPAPGNDAGRTTIAKALRGERIDDVEYEAITRGRESLWLRARTRPSAGRVLWILQDITATVLAKRRAEQLNEKLDMAREFGRLGIWERDIRSGKGQWDQHVLAFWGLQPTDGTPDFDRAAAQVHPEDRWTAQVFRDSLRQTGRHSERFRVVRSDGSTRWIHSQWVVKPGASDLPERVVGVMMDDTEVFELARSLTDTSEQLQLAVELGDIAFWRHDLKTQLMHYSDRAFQVLDMVPRPQGMTIDEVRSLIHPDDLPRVLASAQETLLTDKPTDFEARYRRSDGSWRYIMTRRVVQRDPSGDAVAFLGVALDVTEQVERSRRSDEFARRLNAAAHAARVGIWTTTPSTDETDWNIQMFELFDLDPEAGTPSLSQWVNLRVHPEERERVWRDTAQYLQHGHSPQEIEFRLIRRDGSTRWIVMRADVDRNNTERRSLMGVALDVTEHRAALAALRRADQRAVLATRSAGIGTWEVDLVENTESWDTQMFVLRGLTPRALPPTREERLALVHPADVPHIMDSQRDAMSSHEPSQYEFRIRMPGGNYRWLASRSIPVRDAQGNTVRRVGVNWDITEGRNAQVALQEKALAERESRAKSQFLSRMSHELRTPLNAVLGFTQLLQDQVGASLGDSDRAKLGHIRAAGEHLHSLINDVLALSSLEAGNLRLDLSAVDMRAVVEQALPLVSSLAAEREVSLHIADTNSDPSLLAWADSTRLLQIVLNLLTNAIKYNRARGDVTITLEPTSSACRLRVTDTGRGMSSAQVAQLFQPFNRLGVEHEGIEGTGIGLVIVKALAEAMGGSLTVSSQCNWGSTFELILPRPTAAHAVGVSAQASTAVQLADTRGVRHGRLLYIEDNAVNVLLVEELVAYVDGLSLVSEPTGQAGVLRAVQLRPDLILVDMQLPDFDGFEVLRRLRDTAETSSIPCIALSANAMPQDIARGLAAGFDDYWTKPIDFKAFTSALERLFPLKPAGRPV